MIETFDRRTKLTQTAQSSWDPETILIRSQVETNAESIPQQLAAPDGWKQFEFNGQYVYVIPADRSGPTAP